jgi:hydroxymethylpyrimidine pyrophosphatase-like HAD family hydrolase
MPRIPQENADAIKKGEVERGGTRKAFEGYALVKLIEAEEEAEKESGYAGQQLKFEVIEPKEIKGNYVWEYISYAPAVNWKWMAMFEAFGFEPDSDTDELIDAGEEEEDPAYVIIDCSIEITTKGKNKGKGKTKIQDFLDPTVDENRELIGVTLADD